MIKSQHNKKFEEDRGGFDASFGQFNFLPTFSKTGGFGRVEVQVLTVGHASFNSFAFK